MFVIISYKKTFLTVRLHTRDLKEGEFLIGTAESQNIGRNLDTSLAVYCFFFFFVSLLFEADLRLIAGCNLKQFACQPSSNITVTFPGRLSSLKSLLLLFFFAGARVVGEKDLGRVYQISLHGE